MAVTAPNPGDCDTAEKLLLKNDALEAKRRVMHAKRVWTSVSSDLDALSLVCEYLPFDPNRDSAAERAGRD
eukprot:SAG31_NODE_954_length_10804_cov_3.240355_7_plen_71_part_00